MKTATEIAVNPLVSALNMLLYTWREFRNMVNELHYAVSWIIRRLLRHDQKHLRHRPSWETPKTPKSQVMRMEVGQQNLQVHWKGRRRKLGRSWSVVGRITVTVIE